MDSIEKLAALFERFPGIGPRQARRFVHFLLRSSPTLRRELVQEIRTLGNQVKQCDICRRFFAGDERCCTLCSHNRRSEEFLMIVASDSDVDAFEQTGDYPGRYFVLGNTVGLSVDTPSVPNERALVSLIKKQNDNLREIILALPANPEGDATEDYVRSLLYPVLRDTDVRITVLGRGLSTGSEIEYADPETIKNAFANRQ